MINVKYLDFAAPNFLFWNEEKFLHLILAVFHYSDKKITKCLQFS